jgi:hypothetical protein
VAIAQALIDAAATFGATHGCTVLRGPFNMTAMQEMGILVLATWDIRSNKNALPMSSPHIFSSYSSERAKFSPVLISLSF